MTDANLHQGKTAGLLRTLLGVSGVVSLAFGLVIVIWPGKSAAAIAGALAVLVAIYAIISGLVYLGLGLFSGLQTGWRRIGNIVLGILFVVAGIIMFSNLGTAGGTLVALIGIAVGVIWLIEGILALTALPSALSRGWSIFYGIVSILGGLSLCFSPLYGALTLWWLVGTALIVMGIVQIARAIFLRMSR